MRHLFILRGIPASGKSSWIAKNDLEPMTLSPDRLRALFSQPVMTEDGWAVSQKNDTRVWRLLRELMEHRMKMGQTLFIDACHTKLDYLSDYKKLAGKYRYRMTVVDFDVPLEVAKERNAKRGFDKVPEFVIDRMYNNRVAIPPKYKVIQPTDDFHIQPLYVNNYKKVVMVGDIHGCYEALIQAIPSFDDDTLYIFTGDYIDRGPDNRKVVEFLLANYERPNVWLLEGNHERHLAAWAHGEEARSSVFNHNTAPQLEGLDKKEVSRLCRKFLQMAYFEFAGDLFLVTHGGLSRFANPIYVSSQDMIKGVGDYDFDVDRAWNENCENVYQVHGHRGHVPPHPYPRSFNLEGKVEFGGALRVLTLTPEGKTCQEYKDPTVHGFVTSLRASILIREKNVLPDISSFNFTREAFYHKKWDSLNQKARGLYVNTKTGNVVARGYDKFFNLNELPSTTISAMNTLKYPVNIWIKENGFLGMLSWNNGPWFSTKNCIDGPYVEAFKELFEKDPNKDYYIDAAKDGNTVLFEVIHPMDPHIIKYEEPKLISLDVIANKQELEIQNYTVTKKLYGTVSSHKALVEFYNHVMEDFHKPFPYIEGFVIGDPTVKIKTRYYDFWKMERANIHRILNNEKTKNHINRPYEKDLHQQFMFWVKSFLAYPLAQEEEVPSIIDLRDMFYAEKNIT